MCGGVGAVCGVVAGGCVAAEAGAPGLERVDVVQPVLLAVMVALAGVWRSVGVRAGCGGGSFQG